MYIQCRISVNRFSIACARERVGYCAERKIDFDEERIYICRPKHIIVLLALACTCRGIMVRFIGHVRYPDSSD